MKQRMKGIVLQCLVFIFFLVLAGNGLYENSVLNKRFLQLRDEATQRDTLTRMYRDALCTQIISMMNETDENHRATIGHHGQLAQDVNDLSGYMIDGKFATMANTVTLIEIAKYARLNRDRLEQETMIALPSVIDAAMKSVVHIYYPSLRYLGRNGSGTGWVLDAEKGYIVTAAHVANNFKYDPESATVEFIGEGKVRIDKVWVDSNDDMAIVILDVNDPNYVGVTAMELSEPYDIRRGDLLLTLGGPFGQKFSAGFGIVSNPVINCLVFYPASTKGFRIQFDTTQNPGNSGGALINIRGKVVGVGVSGISMAGDSSGVNFGVTLEGIRLSLERFEVWLGTPEPGIVEMIH